MYTRTSIIRTREEKKRRECHREIERYGMKIRFIGFFLCFKQKYIVSSSIVLTYVRLNLLSVLFSNHMQVN